VTERAYFNEFDSKLTPWLQALVDAGEIAAGDVDSRSIVEVKASDLEGFTQVHFFAGIGGWSHALRLAGWPDSRRVWTGSCPCQPFSTAGKRKGQADERHLWPAMFRLIAKCHPNVIFGEQVASAIGHGWLDGISANLEGEGYAVGAVVLGAHSVGSPHIRQRLYWVAESELPSPSRLAGIRRSPKAPATRLRDAVTGHSRARGPADAGAAGRDGARPNLAGRGDEDPPCGGVPRGRRPTRGPADTSGGRADAAQQPGRGDGPERPGPWSDWEALAYRDGTHRRTQSGLFPLAHGIPRSLGPDSTREQRMELVAAKANRVIRLRGYGNAIVAPLAAEFVRAYMETSAPAGPGLFTASHVT